MTNFSIHTNASSQVALNTLKVVQTNHDAAQKQVSTGLKVADPTDNASVFAVAQGVRSDLAAYDTIEQSLNNGLSAVNVAITGATAVSNLITDVTKTLTFLADGTLTDTQRETYSSQLVNQVHQIRTDIDSSVYNGVDLIQANEGTALNAYASAYFTNFTPATPLTLPAGLGGGQLSIVPPDLTGGSAGTDGWLGLARIAYFVATNTVALATGPSITLGDTVSTAFLGYGTQATAPLLYRSLISSNIAIAALAPLSASASAYITGTSTTGVASVFGGAVANFQVQVNQALGTLGANYSNISAQITFVSSLGNSLTNALGNLVDANLAKTSAKLTALGTQEQLATQALSIANSQPNTLLSLFRAAA